MQWIKDIHASLEGETSLITEESELRCEFQIILKKQWGKDLENRFC